MRSCEEKILNAIIEGVRIMQKADFEKCIILKNLDNVIEKLHQNVSNNLLNCLFDIRQNVILDKKI